MLKLECDRCKAQFGPVHIYGVPGNGNPYADVRVERPAMYQQPEGWSNVLGKTLCASCTREIEYSVNQQPIKPV